MSHTMNIKVEMHDIEILRMACEKLGLEIDKEEKEYQLFSSIEKGIGVKLPGWQYPVVVKNDGRIAYDNYGGRWGSIEKLNELRAHYGLEKAKEEARKKGYSFYENYNSETEELELKIIIN